MQSHTGSKLITPALKSARVAARTPVILRSGEFRSASNLVPVRVQDKVLRPLRRRIHCINVLNGEAVQNVNQLLTARALCDLQLLKRLQACCVLLLLRMRHSTSRTIQRQMIQRGI
eukprot:12703-Prymnesium_polylepis.2